MAPTLVDTRGWIKFGFMALFFVATIFSGGYILGYQEATVYHQTSSNTVALTLPERINTTEHSIGPVVPEVTVAGEKIDVDQPGRESVLSAVEVAVVKIATAKMEKQAVITNTGSQVTQTAKVSQQKSNDVVLKNPNGLSFIPENVDLINYSIQLGVYRRLGNAEKLVAELRALKFDAYVSDYLTRKGEIRYNVRLGYFIDKRSAVPTLEYFRSKQEREAYLVKFSLDSMVDLVTAKADAASENNFSDSVEIELGSNFEQFDVQQPDVQEFTIKQSTIEQSTAQALQRNSEIKKISQAPVFSTSKILTN